MTRKTLHPLPESWTPPQVMMDELEQEPDMAAVAVETNQAHVTLEHHIVYSPTFQVPVLYFNAFDPG